MTTYLSTSAANSVYNWLFLGTVATAASRYITVYSDVDAGTEIAVTRVNATTVLGSPSAGDGANTSNLSFVLPGSITTVDGVGIWDASSGGNEIIRWGVNARTYAASATAVFNVSDLFMNVDAI